MKYLRAFNFNREFHGKEFDSIQFGQVTVFCGCSDTKRTDVMNFICQNIFNKYEDYDYESFCEEADIACYDNAARKQWDKFNCSIHDNYGYISDAFHTGELHAVFQTDDNGLDILPSKVLILRANDLISYKYDEDISVSSWMIEHYRKFEKYDICFIDSPETGLSLKEQIDFVKYIEQCAYEYKVQFVIMTSSPVIAKINEAVIYDMDSSFVTEKQWNDVNLVKEYMQFFNE